MKKYRRMPWAALLALAALAAALASCDLLFGTGRESENLDVLEEGSFYAQNMINRSYYKVKAEVLYEGGKCVIWAEKGSGVRERQARGFADEFDNVIRPRIVDAFSKKDFAVDAAGGARHFGDMLDYANWLAGRDDRKLTILLLDIKDGYRDPRTDSYVAGYFFSGNLRPAGKIPGSGHYSNGRDMIYVDTYPGLTVDPDQTYTTFAHELQHLINYVTSVQMNRAYAMDTWIDEGLSSQAEYLYLGKNPEEKCEWYAKDPAGTIARGNNFFVWDNYQSIPLSILDDYATVYLFFRWLYLQAPEAYKPSLFYDIATAADTDYRAVAGVARKINPQWGDWASLLGTWLAANYYPANDYGYSGDDYLKETIKAKPIAEPSIRLYPGEGVYSVIDHSFEAASTANIRYAGLAGSDPGINTASPYREDVLLTFNANTNDRAASETGYLTGASPAPSPASRNAAGYAPAGMPRGPYVIDAGDLWGREQK